MSTFRSQSHPAFCSARELTARAELLGGRALDVIEGVTVRMERVHLEMLESFRSAGISEVACSLAILQSAEEGGFGELLPRPLVLWIRLPLALLEALNRSRSALGWSPPAIVNDGPDAYEVGKTGCPNDDEHDLRSMSREQVVGSSFACPSDDQPVCKFDNSEIPAVELGLLMLRLGGSLRGWFDEFVKKKLEPGDRVYEELHLWIRAYELAIRSTSVATPAWTTWIVSSRALLTL